MTILNFTPHSIALNDGTVFEPSGQARVSASFKPFSGLFTEQVFGDVTGLPEEEDGTVYIVSSIVLSAAKDMGRKDCVAPATGHPDTVRNEKGHIVSVPGFVR